MFSSRSTCSRVIPDALSSSSLWSPSSLSGPLSGSATSLAVISAVLVYSPVVPVGVFTVASKLTDVLPPLVTFSPVQVISLPERVPPSLMVPMVYPLGTRSVRSTPVASEVPALETARVKVTVSPTLAVVGLTLFIKLRSADCRVIAVVLMSSSVVLPLPTVESGSN